MIIHYVDANKKKRTATYISRCEGLVKWKLDEPPCGASRYYLDGDPRQVVQIPDDAFRLLNEIDIEDHEEEGLPVSGWMEL